MMEILVPEDMNDSMSSIVLDGVTYYIRLCYNGRYDFWNIGLYDATKSPLLPMTKVVPYFNIFGFYRYTDFPPGMFMFTSQDDTISGDSFSEGRAHLYYFEEDEIEDLEEQIAARGEEDS